MMPSAFNVNADTTPPAVSETLERRLDSVLESRNPNTQPDNNNAQNANPTGNENSSEENVVETAIQLQQVESCYETLFQEFQALANNVNRSPMDESRLTDIAQETHGMFTQLNKMVCPPSLEIRRQALLQNIGELNNQIC